MNLAGARRVIQPCGRLGVSIMKRVMVVCGALLLAMAATAAAEVKVAYVDVQRALNECDAGKKAKAEFHSRISGLEQRLQRQQREVQALKDELEKKGMLMKDDERRNLEDEYGRKARDFDRAYKDSREDLQKRDNEITGAIVSDIARVIRSLGEKDGYTMVFEKGSILWGTPAIDITDQVIRAYNASHSKIGALSAPAQAPAGGSFGQSAARRSTISK